MKDNGFSQKKSPIPILFESQKRTIDEWYDKEDLGALTRRTFGNPKLDGRTNEGKAIKMYLAEKSEVVSTTKKIPVPEVILTDEQRKFIEDNIKEMKPLEMAKVLFPDANITTLLRAEGRAIYRHCKVVDRANIDFWDEPVDSKEYRPPSTLQAVLGLTNSYVANPVDSTKSYYVHGNLRPYEEKSLRALQGYLKTTRFRYQAAQYDKKADRTLFESSFIRTTHDKPDLSAADVDMYVAGAAEMVNITREERKILRLEDKLNAILGDGGDDEGGERQHLSQAFVELINQTRTKWDASKKRYQDIMGGLESTRAKRDEHKIQRSQSVLNLLEAWQKDEETRNDIIAFGVKEKMEDAQEVKRLTEMDGVIALIAGMTVREGSM